MLLTSAPSNLLPLFGLFNLSTVLLITVIVLILATFVIIGFINRYKFIRAFSGIPGPTAIPLFGNAFQLTGSQNEFFKLLVKYSTSYDDMFRLWIGQRPFVFIYTAEAVQPLLNSSLHIDKSLEYKMLHELLGNGLVTGTGSKWHLHRKLLTPVFHYNILEEYLQPAKKVSDILVKQLSSQVGQTAFNIVPYLKLTALDFICDITLGYQLNSQLNSNSDYVRAIEELMSIAQRRFITPWLKPNFLFKLSSYSKNHYKSLDIVTSFSNKMIEERKKNNLERNSALPNTDCNKNISRNGKGYVFLDLLLKLSENESIFSEKDVLEEVNTFIFAGHDTTSLTVSWTLYLLGLHPQMQDKVIDELKEKLPDFGKSKLKVSDLAKLDYLECCIKETLRLYPTVPLLARHLTKPINIQMKDIFQNRINLFQNDSAPYIKEFDIHLLMYRLVPGCEIV